MVSLPRALSKLGLCSRAEGERAVRDGRVRVNGRVVREPSHRVDLARDRIALDDREREESEARETRVHLALNKPRGLVTTRHDPCERETVYDCLDDAALPFVSPVGRLDKASEGLLLFTNDTRWAAHLTDPASHVEKTYHVQIDAVADEALLARMEAGVSTVDGERLAVKRARLLRHGGRNSWLKIVLDEGRNRHIRRVLEALDLATLRLVRVSIGTLALGTLAKGAWRHLTTDEVRMLAPASASRMRAPSERRGTAPASHAKDRNTRRKPG